MDTTDDRFKINPLRLEEEWERHPQMVINAARAAADAVFAHSEAEDESKRMKAECEKSVRDHPGRYGLEKITEAAIDMAVNLHPDYLIAKKKLREAHYRKALADADMAGLMDRKRALSKLSDLYVHEYYSDQKSSTAPNSAVQNRAYRRELEQRQEESAEDQEVES
jgi:hypothetical protein